MMPKVVTNQFYCKKSNYKLLTRPSSSSSISVCTILKITSEKLHVKKQKIDIMMPKCNKTVVLGDRWTKLKSRVDCHAE